MDLSELIKMKDAFKETAESLDRVINALEKRDRGENATLDILTSISNFTDCYIKLEKIDRKKLRNLKIKK